jgi:hypothetical protein
VAHCREYGVAHCCIWEESLEDMWWLIERHIETRGRIYGESLEEMWRLKIYVKDHGSMDHCKECYGSLQDVQYGEPFGSRHELYWHCHF